MSKKLSVVPFHLVFDEFNTCLLHVFDTEGTVVCID